MLSKNKNSGRWSLLLLITFFTNLTWGQRFDLNSLRQAVVKQEQRIANDNKDTHFEHGTGNVYTTIQNMLDSKLMLTDCIKLCQRNATCKSANFKTGLCVLFGSSAQNFPGKIFTISCPMLSIM